MFCGDENARCIINPDSLVQRAMKHQQGLMKLGNRFFNVMPGKIIKELFFDGKGPAAQGNLGLPGRANFIEFGGKIFGYMFHICGGRDGGNRPRLGNIPGNGKHGRAAQ